WTAEEEGETELMVKSVDDEETVESSADVTVSVQSAGICSWWLLVIVLAIGLVILLVLWSKRKKDVDNEYVESDLENAEDVEEDKKGEDDRDEDEDEVEEPFSEEEDIE
ncbi:MAG: hypothetical protein ACOCTR_02820, partial [Candidatus Natronoplasma sp.]